MDTERQSKRNNSSVDFMIVGQGIAGSIIALSLIKAGYSVLVIDKSTLSSSSKVAGGIWNPIVFKRLTKSWLADELVPELITFYSYWENQFNTSFIHHKTIIKPFTEEQEKKLWLKKANDLEHENHFLDKLLYENLTIDNNYKVDSYSKVLQAGNIDVPHFLNFTKQYLIHQESYVEEEFDYHKLTILPNTITYNNIVSNQIIFCEGHLISKNPYFNWIPMKPAKGETLTIHSNYIQLKNDIFNKGFFIMPLGNNLFKIGATYEWDELNDFPTDKAKTELLKKLDSVVTTPYTIISHDAGVRPSVIDRRPVIGNHPEYHHMHVFNGLGTKAVMIAPYFAKQFIESFKNKQLLDKEVNPNRFYSKK